MYQAIIIVHVLLGLGVIGFVLIQQGKGADAGAAFGSASSGSVFGAQGASTLFFATSLGLAVLSGQIEEEVNLMDVPEAEKVFEDVPLIDSADNEASTESIPVISADTVETVVQEEQTATE